jgi:hypothetical protein
MGNATYLTTFAIMKLLFTALGIFLLYLSCIPCSDNEECNDKVATQLSSAEQHKNHSHEKETCTPFCTCSCCAISAFSSPLTRIVVIDMGDHSVKHPLFNVSIHAEAHYSIWQPPKVA